MSSKARKRKKKKMIRKIKKHHRTISSVVTLLAIISFFSFVGTFAWFTSEDNATNKFEGGKLIAEIDEVFIPNEKWEPGEKTDKEIRVKNTGNIPAFVRLSLYEFMLRFEVDVIDETGNANLKTVKQPQQPEVVRANAETWKKAAEGKGTYKQDNLYYVASEAWISNPKDRKDMFDYNKVRVTAPYKFVTLNFTDQVKTTVDTNATSDYWLYSNGYFYYSRPLKPGERSQDLLQSLTLSDSIPNKYKGSLYKMEVYMDAHDVTEPVIGAWELKTTDPAYDLIKKQLK